MKRFNINSGRWWVYGPEIAGLIQSNQPWSNSTGTISGRPECYPPAGRLPGGVLQSLRADQESPGIDYVIFSYATPIAWRVRDVTGQFPDGKWVCPDVKYTVTTTKHQHKVQMILGVLTGKIPVPNHN